MLVASSSLPTEAEEGPHERDAGEGHSHAGLEDGEDGRGYQGPGDVVDADPADVNEAVDANNAGPAKKYSG